MTEEEEFEFRLRYEQEQATQQQETPLEAAQPAEEGGYFTEMAKNIPGSAYDVGKSMVHAVTHPAETINTLGEAFFGGAENLAEAAGWEKPEGAELSDVGRYSKEADLQQTANIVGGVYKDRYGTLEKAKETFKTDPVGALLDASMLTTGAGGALAAVPKAGKVAQVTRNVGAAIDPINIAASGAKIPGAIIPEGVKAATTGAVANLLPRHRTRGGKALSELAGPQGPEIIKNLEYQAQAFPGSQPTAIQAALGGGRLGPGGVGPPSPPITRPQFAALEKPMQRRKPAAYETRMEEQRVARADAIQEGIARSPRERKAAVKARKDATDPMYAAARESAAPVDIMPVIDKIDSIIAQNPGNKRLVKEMESLKNGLYDGKVPRTKANEIISSIEGLKTTMANQKNAYIKRELQGIKTDLIDSVPLYKAADETFREMSRPINQMDIGKYLVEKIRPIKGDIEGSTKYINALENARLTVKNSLGEPRYKSLEEILDPQQQQILANARSEINRDAVIAASGKKGYGRMSEVLESALDPIELPGMLSSKMMVARNIMGRLKGAGTAKTMKYLADRQLSGPEWAAMMKEATPREKAILGSRELFNKRMAVSQALFQPGRAAEENK